MPESMVPSDRPPDGLRAAVARDLMPVVPLSAPWMRALALLPLGVLLLVAAPLMFEVRIDAPRLGWFWSWGLSLLQLVVGLALVATALVEAVPGRSWSSRALLVWLLLPIVTVIATTLITFAQSPTGLRGSWWTIGAMCTLGSFASALPAVLFASILAVRAYVTRPLPTGALLGLGGGIMADSGWRLFCHFSEPDHVLTAHLAGIVASALVGALVVNWMAGAGWTESRDPRR